MKTEGRMGASSNRRRLGLFKKARELEILCGCEIGIIIYSSTGDLSQYSTVSMQDLISKYTKGVELKGLVKDRVKSSGTSGRLIASEELSLSNEKLEGGSENTPAVPDAIQVLDLLNDNPERMLVEILTEQVKKIQSRQRPLSKEDEDCVQKLIEMIEEFLVLIREREEELIQKQQHSRLQEEQYMQETEASNETESQAINFLDLFSSTSSTSEPIYFGLGLIQCQSSSSSNNNSDIFLKFDDGEDDSDTILQLGVPIRVDPKKPDSGL